MQGVLPLSPHRYPRLLVHTTGIVGSLGAPVPLSAINLLRSEGFQVVLADAQDSLDTKDFDAVLYLMAEENVPLRGRVFFDWTRLHGDFLKVMHRSWHDVPTVVVSFGYPFYLYDAPRMPCLVNAYGSTEAMQRAVIDCLIGRTQFSGRSPIDPFCGLAEAHY